MSGTSTKSSKAKPAPAAKKTPWALWAGAAVLVAVVLMLVTRPAGPTPGDVDSAQFAEVIASGGAMLVDVRTPAEYASGHIPGATNVSVEEVPGASASWDKAAKIALYCQTGSRSASAMDYLRGQGFTDVYNLTAGIQAWDGEVVQGEAAGAPAGAVQVETNGKPVVLEFSGST